MKVKEASLEENLRYHTHLVVRPRGRIPRQDFDPNDDFGRYDDYHPIDVDY